MIARELDFQTVDDLGHAFSNGRIADGEKLEIIVNEIGPWIEYQSMIRSCAGYEKIADDRIQFSGLTVFRANLLSNDRYWNCGDTKDIGFIISNKNGAVDESDVYRTSFLLDAEHCAVRAGFSRQTAKELIGAIRELEDNIYAHSGKSASGLIAYQRIERHFSFVVRDLGIGILASLRTCPVYQDLVDHGEALRLALETGTSRYGPETGHGFGFRQLWLGLANHQGNLRFRTGNYSLQINDAGPSLKSARLAQKPPISGFLASIDCSPT
ncbi:MAG: hypothetical protein KIT79_11705 [Deltaproteobacteria bacterium]|nr:hypothetical protein [Deltaproteobacteria bacterium]